MSSIGAGLAINKGFMLPGSAIANSVARRAIQVGELLRQRRVIALRFKRTQDDGSRIELERIDSELAKHQIDIPAVQRRAAAAKT